MTATFIFLGEWRFIVEHQSRINQWGIVSELKVLPAPLPQDSVDWIYELINYERELRSLMLQTRLTPSDPVIPFLAVAQHIRSKTCSTLLSIQRCTTPESERSRWSRSTKDRSFMILGQDRIIDYRSRRFGVLDA